MARKKNSVPQYLLHQQSGQARVRVDGRDYMLGPFGSPESRVRYGDIIARHSRGQPIEPRVQAQQPQPVNTGLTIAELVLAFMRHAERHYRKNGKPTSEIHCLRSAIRPLIDLYSNLPVEQFSTLMLKACRERMISSGWCRNTINKHVGRIRTVFRWGVENQMVPLQTLGELETVAALLEGRTEAHDNEARQPVSDQQIAAVRQYVSTMVWQLIQVQRLTGARSGELVSMTPAQVDRTGKTWLYSVDGHKTAHHGHHRVIAIGKRAQAILQQRMQGLNNDQPVFQIQRSSYAKAIARACVKAGVEHWCPHQLRHAMGHQVRQEFSLEHVQATLGHADFAMAEHYGRQGIQRAIEVAEVVG